MWACVCILCVCTCVCVCVLEMGWYIDASLYRNMQNSDTGIDTTFNVSMHHNNRWIHLNNMTDILIILKVQVRLKKKVGLFCRKNYILHYLRNAIYRCIMIFLGQCIDTFKSCIVPSLVWVCLCVCACARTRVCVRARVYVCAHVYVHARVQGINIVQAPLC